MNRSQSVLFSIAYGVLCHSFQPQPDYILHRFSVLKEFEGGKRGV